MSIDLVPDFGADSPFLPNSQVQFAWDSVSLTSILACPRRYQYQIVEGYVPSKPGFAIALTFGILFHRGLEFYHVEKAAGKAHDRAVEDAMSRLLADPMTATLPTDVDVEEADASADPDDDGITSRNAKVRTRYHLLRSLVWYLEHYRDDPCETFILPSGKAAVELSFRIPVDLPDFNHPVVLCGHLDRVARFNDHLYVVDYKTTKSLSTQFFETFNLSHQLTGYTVAGNVILPETCRGAMIDGIGLLIGSVKFSRAPSPRTPGQIKDYFHTLAHAQQLANSFAAAGYYPMNTSACYFCDFKSICAQPPEYREKYLKLHFTPGKGWNPLSNR